MNPLEPATLIEMVAVKLPTFDPIDPELWFDQCETLFGIKNVATDQTKYYFVVATLDSVVQDALTHTYGLSRENLKWAHLATYDLSDEQKAGKILDAGSLGDM